MARTDYTVPPKISMVQWNEMVDAIGVEPAAYIVFEESSLIKAKNGITGNVDFSGTDAATVIQSAINALTAGRTWQERVAVKGNFTVAQKISLPGYAILDLRGAKLTLSSGVNDNMIETNTNALFFSIMGGVLDGAKTGQISGSVIRVTQGAQRFFIGYGMRILNGKDYGVHLEGISGNAVGVGTLVNIDIEDSGSHGILSSAYSADHLFSELNLGGNSGNGLTLSSSDSNIIVDSLAWNNSLDGFNIYASSKNILIGNRSDYNTYYGIRLDSNANDNLVTDNQVYDNGSGQIIKVSGTGNIIRHNRGFATENTGAATITSGNTSVSPSHGLAVTPTRVYLTPTTDTGGKYYWISAKAASTFTITIDSSYGSDISFDWRAEAEI